MIQLGQDIKFLQGVGPSRASLLDKELGIKTVGDMLTYYPFKYVDKTRIYNISDIDGSMPYVQIKGEILSADTVGEGRGRRLVARLSDGTGVVELVWFQGIKFVMKNYSLHTQYIVFGKPTVFGGRINIAHPEIEKADDGRQMADSNGGMRFVPSYNTTEKMKRSNLNSNAIRKLMQTMFAMFDHPFPETLPSYLVEKNHLISYDDAIRNIHFPKSPDMLRKAQARLKFEELFYVQLNIQRYVRDRNRKYRGIIFPRIGDAFNGFYHNHLPFELTNAQKRVLKEIRKDMGSGRQMNRLLQGDVGSGKTLVALMSMLIAVDNGCQACMMAPTEILAEQHLQTLRAFLGDMPVRVELLTGSVKGKKREKILHDLLTGDVHILVGTHAVIEDNVAFCRLGLAIIDEQHRFGVAQRAKMWQKNAVPPHVLVMTATPIPRTLAMTLYGDLDVSVIDELPPGRKPIETLHMFDSHRAHIYKKVRQEMEQGRQVYIVYPLIQESEKIDLKNLEEGYVNVCKEFEGYSVSKVHGKMKPAEKDAEMQRFAKGETQILVATTVIEVGVNVPNASVMVIENAERFGLSQLHQLRGRVGRGADQSYCILVTKYEISTDTRKRIQIMVDSTDGFEIAEQDLKLRGPGDLEGTQQSGMAFDLKIANIATDGILLQMAKDAAQLVLDNDPDERNPQNDILWRRLQELRKTNINWGSIS
ncbi:MAG: ATP-dependent DNA helicase RecG [Bacteroidaceae bacterium]|nr:ATP-dependent DNA helicase RecG [Bacteroidaceae bacterium]